jgi:hypothetical protein
MTVKEKQFLVLGNKLKILKSTSYGARKRSYSDGKDNNIRKKIIILGKLFHKVTVLEGDYVICKEPSRLM